MLGALGAAVLYLVSRTAPGGDDGLASWLGGVHDAVPWTATAALVLLIGVPAAVAGIAVGTRSWRLLLSAMTAGLTAVAVVVVVGPWTEPSAERAAQLASLGVADWFPLWEVALPVALLAVGSAFLARPVRRALDVAVVVGLVALVIGGVAFPIDVGASALVGWAAAGLAGLVFGAPVGDAVPDEVVAAMADLGLEVADVEAVGHPVWGTARYRGTAADGRALFIDGHGREASDARLLQRMWHASIDAYATGQIALGRAQLAEHQALCLALAARGGVPVPDLVAVGVAGPSDDGYVVVADSGARPMQDVPAGGLDDATLRSAWEAVRATHEAGLAHQLLDGASVWVRPDGTVELWDWTAARLAPDDAARHRDVAALLLVTAAQFGVERALRAARAVVGDDGVGEALPLCQRALLDRRARAKVTRAVAGDVRTAGAAALGMDPPELADLRRVSTTDLLMIGGTLLGFWLLANELLGFGDLWATLGGADWGWVAVVALLAPVSLVFVAIALRGAVTQSVPLGRVVLLEFADTFTGLVGGTVAIVATNVRFFQRQGIAAATAVTAGVTSSLAGGAVQAVIIVVSLPLLIASGRLELSGAGGQGGGRLLVVLLLGAALVSGVVALVPRFRGMVVHKLGPQLHTVRDDLRDLLHRPRQLATMVGGQAASQVVLALALGAALLAFGGELGFLDLLVINTFAALIGGLAPVPGGMGAVEAGLIGGFTAFGVDSSTAVAATFIYRLWTAYLPPAWGWPILAWLRRRELL